MLEAFKDIQVIFLTLDPTILIICGLLLIIPGLFIWLGGVRHAKMLAGLLGAIIGITVATVMRLEFVALAILTVVGAGFGVFFKKLAVSIIGGAIVFPLVILFFAGPVLQETGWIRPQHKIEQQDDSQLNPEKSMQVITTELASIAENITRAVKELDTMKFAVAGIAALVFAVLGLVLHRLFGSLSCALLGTLVIGLGMTTLLLFKGSAPLTTIHAKPDFYGLIAAAMIGAGTVVQILMYPKKKIKPAKQENEDGGQ